MKKLTVKTILAVLILALAGASIAQAEVIPPYGEGQIGLPAVVLCESLTVRKEPASNASAVQKLGAGRRIIVTKLENGWAECFLSDAVDAEAAGWVNADYIAVDPAWYRTEGKTYVYAWGDTAAPKVALLGADVTLPVLKTEGEWLVVGLRGASGWIHDPENADGTPDTASVPDGEPVTGLSDGERYETVIMVEGMEETVSYEHAVNANIGIEIDFDHEALERISGPDSELFVSVYDDSRNPENYLEIIYSEDDADTAADQVYEELSQEYEITAEERMLAGAGNCICIDASGAIGGEYMPEQLQVVYIIPAEDGCRIARAHFSLEAAEGFGVRFARMMDTLQVFGRSGE